MKKWIEKIKEYREQRRFISGAKRILKAEYPAVWNDVILVHEFNESKVVVYNMVTGHLLKEHKFNEKGGVEAFVDYIALEWSFEEIF